MKNWYFCHCSCHHNPGVHHVSACCSTCMYCEREVAGDMREHIRDAHKAVAVRCEKPAKA